MSCRWPAYLLNPRSWSNTASGIQSAAPVTVALDILDEDHSLRVAMKRLAEDADLRQQLGSAAQAYWLREHSPAAMRADYLRIMSAARSMPAPLASLPGHLVDDGLRRLQTLMAPFGITAPLA